MNTKMFPFFSFFLMPYFDAASCKVLTHCAIGAAFFGEYFLEMNHFHGQWMTTIIIPGDLIHRSGTTKRCIYLCKKEP